MHDCPFCCLTVFLAGQAAGRGQPEGLHPSGGGVWASFLQNDTGHSYSPLGAPSGLLPQKAPSVEGSFLARKGVRGMVERVLSRGYQPAENPAPCQTVQRCLRGSMAFGSSETFARLVEL